MIKRQPAVNGILAAVLSASFPAPLALAKDAAAPAPLVEAKTDGPASEELAGESEPAQK